MNNESLKVLEVGKCRLNDLAGCAIANSLNTHPNMLALAMNENNLKD